MKQNFFTVIDCVGKNIFYNIVISLSILYYFNPFKPVDMTSFNRMIGDSVIAGYSFNDRIRNVYLYIAGFILIYICVAYMIEKLKNDSIYFDVFKDVTKFLSGVLLIYFVNRFQTDMVLKEYIIMLEMQLTLVVLLVCSVKIKGSEISKEMLSSTIVFSMSMALMMGMLLSPHIRTRNIGGGGYRVVEFWHLFFYIIIFGGLNTILCRKTKLSKKSICALLLIVSPMPLIYRLYVEVYYILSGYGIILIYPYITGLVITAAMAGVLAGIFYIKRATLEIPRLLSSASVMLLVSMIIISYMLNRVAVLPWSEEWAVYEWGNSFSALDTFRYGRLPIAEYFPSHALRDNIPGLIYGAINKLEEGLMAMPYGKIDQILGMAVIFIIIKNCYSTLFSLAFCALLPLHYYMGFRMPTFCFAAIIAFWQVKDKNTVRSYIVYWVCMASGLLYILDEGFALGMAAILFTFILCFIGRLKIDFKKWILSGIFVGSVVLLYFMIGSAHSGVPILTRIQQFLSASLGSNGVWAIRTIGDTAQFSFWWGYCFANVSAVVFLGVAMAIIWKGQVGYLETGTAIFCIATLLNIPRTMVFHNMSTNPGIVFLYLPWVVAFGAGMVYQYKKRLKDPWCFFSVFVGCVFIDCVTGGGTLPPTSSIYKSAVVSSSNFAIDNALNADGHLSRFQFGEELKVFVNKFELLFDRLLSKDETFVDGANLTSLYAMTERKNPSYLTQLPSGLTNEFSQEKFIDEIENAEAPLLVLGQQQLGYTTSMTGVSHPVRYYKVYEYFYQRYRPLLSIEGKYAIWCHKEKYDIYREKISSMLGTVYQPVMYGYDLEAGIHNYYVGSLPYVWGNYDENTAWENKEIKSLRSEDGVWYDVGEIEKQDKEQGNYLMLTAESNTQTVDTPVNLTMVHAVTGETLYNYTFTPAEGKQRYLIRISSDYFWYHDTPLAVLNANSDIFKIDAISIIEGD